MATTNPLLELRRVSKAFGPRTVLREVSLTIASGEVLLLAGPNGAGKTTLLKIMAGLCRPSAGEARSAVGPGRIALVGERNFVYPGLTGLENLTFWAGLHGLPAQRAGMLAALERMALGHAAEDRAGTYSRGMGQRLSLARVLLGRPELILLDEPATGLDARSTALFEREMEEARGRGAAVVWISHHLERDLPRADRLLTLRAGRPEYLGPARDFRPEAGPC